jgi:uncharacterized protein
MDMQGSRQLAVTQQQAWDALNNPEVLKTCIPGCDKVEPTAENQYAVGMALKIGPVAAKFTGKITLSDINPPHSYNIAFDGQGGVAGHGKGSAAVKLEPNDQGCLMTYVVNAQVGGKIAQMGQRLIDGVAKSMAEDFFKRFDAEMERQHPAAYAAAAEAAAATVSDAAQGADTGGGSKIPVWVWVAGAVVVLAAIWLLR